MKIGIVRHAKVNYRNKRFTTGATFIEGLKNYDAAQTAITNLKIKASDFPACYTSSQPRAMQTAKMIYPGQVVITDDLVEVPTASFILTRIQLPTLMRKILSRIAWYLNLKIMPETRSQTMLRAERFVNTMLSENKTDVLLITHGFFMFCLKRALFKHGFRGHIALFPKNAMLYVMEIK